MTSLTGAQQVPPVTTSASAVTDITARTSKCQSPASPNNCPHLMGNVYTYGLSPTAAHVHQGAPVQNGPPIVTLVKVSETTWAVPHGTQITESQYEAFWAGNLYVNMHTAANKDGEIRAQLKP